MLRNNDLIKYSSILVGQMIGVYINDDRWRLENNFYGVYNPIGDANSSILLIGARSGLEILYFLTNTRSNIIVVENNSMLIDEITNCLQSFEIHQRVLFINEDSISQIENLSISFLRLDLLLNKEEKFLQKILEICKVDYLVGEIDTNSIYILNIVRLLREKSINYSLKILNQSNFVINRDSVYPYEVSVIVPCYKVLPWVDRCVESLVNQTLTQIEIILVDDGSPDDTGKRLDEWKVMFPEKIKVIHKPNGGCASARNIGLKEANGEFVAFVDSDDWVDTIMFERLYEMAILHSAEVSQCGYKEIFEDSGRIEYYPTAWGASGFNGMSGLTFDPKTFLNVKPTIWRRIYKKDFLSVHNIYFGEHMKRFDDLPFQFEILAKTKRMAIIPDCYYYYRQEREGQDIAVKDERLYVHFLIFDWLKKNVLNWCDSEIESYMFKTEMNTHLWALSRIEKRFFFKYLTNAADQIFKNRVHLNFIHLLKIALKNSRKSLFFIILARILTIFPKNKIDKNK